MNVALPVVGGPEATLVLVALAGVEVFRLIYNSGLSVESWAGMIYTMAQFFQKTFCP